MTSRIWRRRPSTRASSTAAATACASAPSATWSSRAGPERARLAVEVARRQARHARTAHEDAAGQRLRLALLRRELDPGAGDVEIGPVLAAKRALRRMRDGYFDLALERAVGTIPMD